MYRNTKKYCKVLNMILQILNADELLYKLEVLKKNRFNHEDMRVIQSSDSNFKNIGIYHTKELIF